MTGGTKFSGPGDQWAAPFPLALATCTHLPFFCLSKKSKKSPQYILSPIPCPPILVQGNPSQSRNGERLGRCGAAQARGARREEARGPGVRKPGMRRRGGQRAARPARASGAGVRRAGASSWAERGWRAQTSFPPLSPLHPALG
jgi:hypothetical protein